VTLNVDPSDVERRITDRTKAIMPVHLFGRPAADMSGFGVPVIEDAAQAFGAGGIATSVASTFSFFPTKNLFALGDGGLIAVNDAQLAERLRMLRFHGSESKKEFLYVGYNSRLDAMQAAFLRVFLPHLHDWNAQRREAAARYTELLDGMVQDGTVETPIDDEGHVYHMYCIRSPERDRLAAALTEADIQFAIYYSPPLHLQPALRYLGYSEGDFPETEKASRENLCLPLWAGITEAQQTEVVSVLKRASELVRS
jgi:dTDP-4-amino-4,6-dideoxygalactose transaminase